MNVYKMNDIDWVAAKTVEEAMTYYEELTGHKIEDFENEEVRQVSLSETTFIPADSVPEEEKGFTEINMGYHHGQLCVSRSFAWVIEQQNINEPCLIASTEA